MPYSMTGFGYATQDFDDYQIEVKIKSLNNKGIDISVKGAKDILFFIDLPVRNKIKEHFERGSFQIFINLKYNKPTALFNKDTLAQALQGLLELTDSLGLSLSDDKKFELANSIASDLSKEEPDDTLKNRILSTVDKACKVLKEERKREGEKLIKDISERLEIINQNLQIIEENKDKIVERLKERTQEKLKELLGEQYSERAFIEATLLADKMDITEEIVRLKSHLSRFKELSKQDKPVGRKMDFLCQEMHREINTLGNKMPDFSDNVIEMKSQLEKIRQQVQNIE